MRTRPLSIDRNPIPIAAHEVDWLLQASAFCVALLNQEEVWPEIIAVLPLRYA